MKRVSVVFVLSMAIATLASAQATRTWVSGVGDDVNPCSRTAPCKTFAGAISKTAAGGIINCLDPGGYGAVTITKAITIDCTGTMGSVLGSGTQGIVINGLTTDNVVLRNLDINGANAGTNGVNVIQAKSVTIEKCRVANYSFGVKGTNSTNTIAMIIDNSEVLNNGTWGVQLSSSGGVNQLNISNTLVSNNGNGIDIAGASNVAVVAGSQVVRNGVGVQVEQTGSTALLESTTVSYNATGLQTGIASNTPTVRLSRCAITANTTQGITGSGTTTGYQNNVVAGNAGNNSVTNSVAQQ